MESRLFGDNGRILPSRNSDVQNNGLLWTLSCQSFQQKTGSPDKSSALGRSLRVTHMCFSSNGTKLLVADHLGTVYLVDFDKLRFKCLHRLAPHCCTALEVEHLRDENTYLVGLSDNSLRLYHYRDRRCLANFRSHDNRVFQISVHPSGRYCVSVSRETVVIWDLERLERKRRLNIANGTVEITAAFYAQPNLLVTCFQDNGMMCWSADQLDCRWILTPPDGAVDLRCFATWQGRLVGAGKVRFLYVWNLRVGSSSELALESEPTLDGHPSADRDAGDGRSLALQSVVELQQKVKSVKAIQFLNPSSLEKNEPLLATLANDGCIRFIGLESCRQLCELRAAAERRPTTSGGAGAEIQKFIVDPSGNRVAVILNSGIAQVYSVRQIAADLFKPPSELVRKIHPVGGAVTRRKQPKMSKVRPIWARSVRDQTDAVSLTDKQRMVARLYPVLREFGEYPVKYRHFIWRMLLQLPENHRAFSSLQDKGIHSAWEKLDDQYPLKSRKLMRVFQRILSALSHWSAICAELDYLPQIIFPILKIFANNQLICFEVSLSILTNWCRHWFEFFPNPPINILALVENLLAHFDKELLDHFIDRGVTSEVYAWNLLKTLFSEALLRQDWSQLMDHVFSNHPAFLLFLCASFVSCCRNSLLRCTELEDFEYFFTSANPVDIRLIISRAYRMQEKCPRKIDPTKKLNPYEPLPTGIYPVFNKYPKFIVDFQAKERQRLLEEELTLVRERKENLELARRNERRLLELECLQRQKSVLEKSLNVVVSASNSPEPNTNATTATAASGAGRSASADDALMASSSSPQNRLHSPVLFSPAPNIRGKTFDSVLERNRSRNLSRLQRQLNRPYDLEIEKHKRSAELAVLDAELRNLEMQIRRDLFPAAGSRP